MTFEIFYIKLHISQQNYNGNVIIIQSCDLFQPLYPVIEKEKQNWRKIIPHQFSQNHNFTLIVGIQFIFYFACLPYMAYHEMSPPPLHKMENCN